MHCVAQRQNDCGSGGRHITGGESALLSCAKAFRSCASMVTPLSACSFAIAANNVPFLLSRSCLALPGQTVAANRHSNVHTDSERILPIAKYTAWRGFRREQEGNLMLICIEPELCPGCSLPVATASPCCNDLAAKYRLHCQQLSALYFVASIFLHVLLPWTATSLNSLGLAKRGFVITLACCPLTEPPEREAWSVFALQLAPR